MATVGSAHAASPYVRLGLAPGAPLAEVKRAYRRLAMQFHPDRAGSAGLQTFLAIKAAYERIVAHSSRAELVHRDRGPVSRTTVARSVRHAPPVSTPPAPDPVTRNTWSGGHWYWEGIRARAAQG